MINAEVTAESRPAYATSQCLRAQTMHRTYEYECRAYIIIVFFHKFRVVLLGLLTVMLEELGAKSCMR